MAFRVVPFTRVAGFIVICSAALSLGCSHGVPYRKDVAVVDYHPASAERVAIPTVAATEASPPISTGEVCSGAASGARLSNPLSLPSVLAIGTIHDGGGHGDVHFDMLNRMHYDFQAVGEFIVLATKSGSMTIQARQQPFGNSTSVSVTTALAMNVAGDVVGVYAGQPAPLRVNHRPVSLDNPVIPLPKGGEIRREGDGFVVLWPEKSQVRVLYGGSLDYIVSLCPPQPPTEGLLASGDVKPGSFPTRRGPALEVASFQAEGGYERFYHVYGDSWRIAQSESLFDYGSGQTTATFTDLKFPYQANPMQNVTPAQAQSAEALCRQGGISENPQLTECTLDVAATGQASFAKNAALLEAIFDRSGTAGAEHDNLQCEGSPEDGWACTIHNLIGARSGTMVKLSVQTLQAGKKISESATCGPIADSAEAPCQEKLRGTIFEGGRVAETFTTLTGEQWERKRPIHCKKEEGQPCGS